MCWPLPVGSEVWPKFLLVPFDLSNRIDFGVGEELGGAKRRMRIKVRIARGHKSLEAARLLQFRIRIPRFGYGFRFRIGFGLG